MRAIAPMQRSHGVDVLCERRPIEGDQGRIIHQLCPPQLSETALLYGLEACPLKSADLKSLDYIVVGAFMKIFKTTSKEVAICCMEMFCCPLPSVSVNNRRSKFLLKFSVFENIVCRRCAECTK